MERKIITAVAAANNIRLAPLIEGPKEGQSKEVAMARQEAVYLMWRYTSMTRDQIAEYLGYTDQTSVNVGRKAVKDALGGADAYKIKIEDITNKILRD